MTLFRKTVYSSCHIMRRLGFDFNESADPRIQAMQKAIQKMGGKIEFTIEQHPDGSWTAESKNINGIITGGNNTKEAQNEIKDAVFTYFGIPPHLCNEACLRSDNKPVVVMQRMYV